MAAHRRHGTRGSPTRWRFRPPVPLTFRLGLAASPYGPQDELRSSGAPWSAHTGIYATVDLVARGCRGRNLRSLRRFALQAFSSSLGECTGTCEGQLKPVWSRGEGAGPEVRRPGGA